MRRRHRIQARLLAEADVGGDLDWRVSVDSTINRAHQHATTLSRVEESARRRPGAPQGAELNYTNLRTCLREEPCTSGWPMPWPNDTRSSSAPSDAPRT